MKNYAGFWTRFAGIFIDGLIIGVLPNIVINTGHGTSMNNPLSFLLGLGYSVWMLGTYGATVGMMVLKIKVIKENGSKITYKDGVLRYFASILSAVVFGLGYFWMIWDSKKQTWHDHIAKTLVIKV